MIHPAGGRRIDPRTGRPPAGRCPQTERRRRVSCSALLDGGLHEREQLCLSRTKSRFLAVLEVQERLMKADRLDPASRAEHEGQRVELTISSEATEEARLPRRRLVPEPTLGPVEDYGAVFDAGENVLLDVCPPVGALGVDEENGPASGSMSAPEPKSQNHTPDGESEQDRGHVDEDERERQRDERKNADRLEA